MADSVKWDNKIDFNNFLTLYNTQHQKALEKLAFVILSDILTKAPRPPIRWSALWGSGSVFVGRKVVAFGREISGATVGTPNMDISEDDENMITVGFNVAYAERMHEHEWNWGKRSIQAGGVGSKFIERKVVGNAPGYLIEYAILLQKGLGL